MLKLIVLIINVILEVQLKFHFECPNNLCLKATLKRFIFRVQGDGKSYQFRVKSQLNEYYSYKFDFSTNKDWQEIEISFDELVPTFRGRTLGMPTFPNNVLEEVGFLISNKIEEDFRLKIDFVKVE